MDLKSFDIGKLREVVKVEKNEPIDDDVNGQVDVYTELLTTRGMLRKKKGNRVLEAGAELFNSGYELVLRFQSDIENELAGGTSYIRFVINNRVYKIDSFEVYQERFSYYIFQLSEQQNR